MDSEKQDSEEQDLSKQRKERTRTLMATYLKFPPYVREAAVRNLAAQLDQTQPVQPSKKSNPS